MTFKSYLKLVLLVSAILFPQVSPAEELGEITAVEEENIKFYSGDVVLTEGEELRIANNFGDATYFLNVTRTKPPYSEGRINRLTYGAGGSVHMLRTGQKIVLEVHPSDIHSIGFFLGTNTFQKVEGFGGSQWGIGFGFTAPINHQFFWDLRVHADSLGKDSNGVEKRRAAYLAGAGIRHMGFLISASMGLIDTMTITTEVANASTKYDPFTGATYPTQGVQHSDQFGYRVGLSYPIALKTVSRNVMTGYALTPSLSYIDTFAMTPYKGYWSLGAFLDFLF